VRRRLKISYRVSLMVAIPGLVVLLSGLIILQSYTTTTREVEELAHSLFRDLSRQAFHRTREHLGTARDMVGMLQELSGLGPARPDRRTLGGEMMAALRSNADYTWVSYSGEDGSFTGAYRASDGSTLVNASWIVDGKTKMEEFNVTGTDLDADPHERRLRLRSEDASVLHARGPGEPAHLDAALRLLRPGDPGDHVRRAEVGPEPQAHRGLQRRLRPQPPLRSHAAGLGDGDRDDVHVHSRRDAPRPSADQVRGVRGEGGAPPQDLRRERSRAAGLRRGGKGRRHDARARGSRRAERAPAVVQRRREALPGGGTAYRINDELSIVVGLAAPEGLFLDPIHQNLRTALVVALVVLVAGFAVALLLANTVARPLLEIADQMDRVAQFDLREPPADRSVFLEIDRMEKSLSNMIRSLSSFAAYVPRDLVKTLVTTGQVARLEGRTKRITILFSDVAGFTSLSEKLAPNELVQRLGAYLSELATVIGREGGTVDKFIGDGVLAFWNAPQDQADHALRAVKAAMACQKRLAENRGADWALPTRIGLATGEVVVGNIGSVERMNYTVVGDTANLASRLEALNKTFGTAILLSDDCAAEAREAVICRPVDVVAVVGKDLGVKVWEPLCLADDPAAPVQTARAALTTQALDAYLRRDFETALRCYRKLRDGTPDDPVARVLADRCAELLQTGVPDDWSGTTKVRHK
jgi:class 3 adenylate cyclase